MGCLMCGWQSRRRHLNVLLIEGGAAQSTNSVSYETHSSCSKKHTLCSSSAQNMSIHPPTTAKHTATGTCRLWKGPFLLIEVRTSMRRLGLCILTRAVHPHDVLSTLFLLEAPTQPFARPRQAQTDRFSAKSWTIVQQTSFIFAAPCCDLRTAAARVPPRPRASSRVAVQPIRLINTPFTTQR